MKALRIIGATALFLALGSNVPAFAQEHQEEAKSAQHQEQAKPAKQAAPARQAAPVKAAPAKQQAERAQPAKQQAQPKAARQETAAKPAQERTQAKAATQPKQAKPEQAKSTKPEGQTKPVKQEARSSPAAGQHPQRTAAEEQKQRAVPALRLSARSSSRIPDARFRANFGSGHQFRIGSPTLVGGYSRFQYGGYWFGFVQPWPVNWYYTDDVYVDFIDGEYYLCDPYYPGVRVAISVVL